MPGWGALTASFRLGRGVIRCVFSAENAFNSMLGGGVGDLDGRECGG